MANCVQQGQEKLKLNISTLLLCLCAVHVMCDQKKWSSKNEHEWIGAGLKNEVKKNERTMFVGTKTISIFLCKERHGLCFGLTAFKYTSIVIQKLNRILNIRYNKKKPSSCGGWQTWKQNISTWKIKTKILNVNSIEW